MKYEYMIIINYRPSTFLNKENPYRLVSPGIKRKVVKICECCNGYYSIVE